MQGLVSAMRSSAAYLALACAATGVGGCGPIGYVGGVVREAGRAVAEAERAGARRAAPYEWTAAVLYLEEARTLAGYARWQDALAMGRRSASLARSATERARRPSPAEPR